MPALSVQNMTPIPLTILGIIKFKPGIIFNYKFGILHPPPLHNQALLQRRLSFAAKSLGLYFVIIFLAILYLVSNVHAVVDEVVLNDKMLRSGLFTLVIPGLSEQRTCE